MKERPKQIKNDHGGAFSDRSMERFKGLIINLQDSMKSLRLSFLSYDSSAATETSVRGKGLSNSTEYMPTTGTMEDDALLYIKRAESVRQKESSTRSRRFGSRSEDEGSSKYIVYRNGGKHERMHGPGFVNQTDKRRYRRASASDYSNTDRTIAKRRERRESTEKTRRSVLSFIVPQKNMNSLCILLVLLIVALVAIITLVGKGEGFLGFGTRATAGDNRNNNENPSTTPSLVPTTLYSGSPSIAYDERTDSPTKTRRGFLSTKSPGTMKIPSVEPTFKRHSTPTTSSISSITAFPSTTELNSKLSTIPTASVSDSKTFEPSMLPSDRQTQHPTIISPSLQPSKNKHLTQNPYWKSTKAPTRKPSALSSTNPSAVPSTNPSKHPSQTPTRKVSQTPSKLPSKQPTEEPSIHPSVVPTKKLTRGPSARPSKVPTRIPSSNPSFSPTQLPSETISSLPSQYPTKKPKRRLL